MTQQYRPYRLNSASNTVTNKEKSFLLCFQQEITDACSCYLHRLAGKCRANAECAVSGCYDASNASATHESLTRNIASDLLVSRIILLCNYQWIRKTYTNRHMKFQFANMNNMIFPKISVGLKTSSRKNCQSISCNSLCHETLFSFLPVRQFPTHISKIMKRWKIR